MSRRNDNLAPFEQPELRRWTRVSDYWPGAGRTRRAFAFSDFPIVQRPVKPKRGSLWGFVVPIAFVIVAVVLSIWGSGALNRSAARSTAAATTSRGLVFGLCSEGGLTNCVASGDSFYLGGKNVRIAGIEAPQLYGAACPREAALGRESAAHLRLLLNSGELEMSKIERDLDRYGLLLRNVSIDGKHVGRTMAASGLARQIGDLTRSWC